MRCIQMVGLCLAFVGFGCSNVESQRLVEASILLDCKPVESKDSDALSHRAKTFFNAEVGVPVSAVKLGPISNCAEKFVIPVEATGVPSKIMNRHPFRIDAMVVLPEHLHAVWTLPPGDAEYPLRWRKKGSENISDSNGFVL